MNKTKQAKIQILDKTLKQGFPQIPRLAKDLGVHRNTVQKYLTELKDTRRMIRTD